MDYFRQNDVYGITKITSNRGNILGVCFTEKNISDHNIEVIAWAFPKCDNSRILTSKEEVLTQVLSALNSTNKFWGTEYKLSKVYYVPSEDGSKLVYRSLTIKLLEHYYSGNKFRHTENEFI